MENSPTAAASSESKLNHNAWNPLSLKNRARLYRAASLAAAQKDAANVLSKSKDIGTVLASYAAFKEWDGFYQWAAQQWKHHTTILGSFVPIFVSNMIAHEKKQPPFYCEFEGVVVWADVVGYSKLSEMIDSTSNNQNISRQTAGVKGAGEGAEAVSDFLNSFFGLLMDSFANFGGEIVKVAGDGLLVLWKVENSEDISVAVQTALMACSVIIPKFSAFEDPLLGFKMQLHAGISVGKIQVSIVGGDMNRWFAVAHGAAVEEATMCAEVTPPGAFSVADCVKILFESDDTAQFDPNPVGLTQLDSLCWKLLKVNPVTEFASPVQRFSWNHQSENALIGFLNPAVAHHLASAGTSILADIRWLSMMFVRITPLKSATAPAHLFAQLQLAVSIMQKIVHKYEGNIKEFGVDDKGTILVAGFGAPVTSHSDDPVRASLAALDMRAMLSAEFEIQIGVTTGTAFCGEIGGHSRREYAMVGSVVNLAARLMMAAQDLKRDVLMDEVTYNLAKDRVAFESLNPILVKGRHTTVNIFYAISKAVSKDQAQKSRASGLSLTNAMLRRQLQTSIVYGRGAKLCIIESAAGLGKTKMLAEAFFIVRGFGGILKTGKLDKVACVQDPFAIWKSALSALLGLDKIKPSQVNESISNPNSVQSPKNSNEWFRAQALVDKHNEQFNIAYEHVWAHMSNFMETCDFECACVLLRLLGHKNLDQHGKTWARWDESDPNQAQSMIQAIAKWLHRAGTSQRVVWSLDNAQNMSEESWDVAMQLVMMGTSVLVAVLPEFPTLERAAYYSTIKVKCQVWSTNTSSFSLSRAPSPIEVTLLMTHNELSKDEHHSRHRPILSKESLLLIKLSPMTSAAVGEMVAKLQNCSFCHPEISEYLRERTGGNPMFVRDWFKAMQVANSVHVVETTLCFVASVDYGLNPKPPASLVASIISQTKTLPLFPQLVLAAASIMGKIIDPLILVQAIPFENVAWNDLARFRKLAMLCQSLESLANAGLLESMEHPLSHSNVNPFHRDFGSEKPSRNANFKRASSFPEFMAFGNMLQQTKSFCQKLLIETPQGTLSSSSLPPLRLYRFPWLLLQDIVYTMTSQNLKQQIHSRLAAFYEEALFGSRDLRQEEIRKLLEDEKYHNEMMIPILINHWWSCGNHQSASLLYRCSNYGLSERYCANEALSAFGINTDGHIEDSHWFAVHIPLVPWLKGVHSCAMVRDTNQVAGGKTVFGPFRFRRMQSFTEHIVDCYTQNRPDSPTDELVLAASSPASDSSLNVTSSHHQSSQSQQIKSTLRRKSRPILKKVESFRMLWDIDLPTNSPPANSTTSHSFDTISSNGSSRPETPNYDSTSPSSRSPMARATRSIRNTLEAFLAHRKGSGGTGTTPP